MENQAVWLFGWQLGKAFAIRSLQTAENKAYWGNYIKENLSRQKICHEIGGWDSSFLVNNWQYSPAKAAFCHAEKRLRE
jgi:hypothetical protein